MGLAALMRLGLPLAMALAAWVTWKQRGSKPGEDSQEWRDDSLDEWRRERDAEREQEREKERTR